MGKLRIVSFSVPGTIRTNERHRHGKGRTFTPARTTAARAEVVQAYQQAAREWCPTIHEGPVKMAVTCLHMLPKSGWPGMACRKKPDLDNVAKLVADALNGVAYRDDAQICELVALKQYSSREGIEVELTFLPEPVKPKHGRIKVEASEWHLYRYGKLLGTIVKAGGRFQSLAFGDGGSAIMKNLRTLAEAEAVIMAATQ